MELKLYNTLTREKELFKPIDGQNVRMYCCGPTVYNYAHIGNGRAAVVFDLLYRLLRHIYGAEHVKYVRNITDVDDKIMNAARETGESIDSITRKFEEIYNEDMAGLGCLPPDVQPRCTEHIGQMIAMTERLVAAGHAYIAEGHVLFSVPSMPDYGQLSRKNRDELIAGARVDVAPYKKDPADFVLWKPSAPEQVGWESPWGRGRPGWHIECSAMAKEHLGETFDIHAGGLDLIFPHHENEIAQSNCAHGKPMANYWLHNGFLNMGDEKMSKSLGNVIYVHDLLKKYHGEVLRLALLSAHYRQPLNFTEDLLEQNKAKLDRLYEFMRIYEKNDFSPIVEGDSLYAEYISASSFIGKIVDDFYRALSDDLNTHLAISRLIELKDKGSSLPELPVLVSAAIYAQVYSTLRELGAVLGILQRPYVEWADWRPADSNIDDTRVQAIVDARIAAKQAKNFAEADRLRDELIAMGIELKDSPQGTEWRYKG